MSRSILVFFIYYRHYQKKYDANFYNISQTFWKTVNMDFDFGKIRKISMEVLCYFMEAEKKNTKKQMEQDLTASLFYYSYNRYARTFYFFVCIYNNARLPEWCSSLHSSSRFTLLAIQTKK